MIENLKPENEEKLKQDLYTKTGLEIDKVKIDEIDYKRKRANIIIYFENK